jgi:hypothetical protein
MQVGGQRHVPAEPLYVRVPVHILQEAGRTPVSVWMNVEKKTNFFLHHC